MADQISFTPREWYDLWHVAKYRYAEGEENYWSTRNKITKQLISVQDEKFREAREKALQIEQRRRDRVKQRKQKIDNHYREYIRNALAQERAEKRNKSPGKKVVLVDARERRAPNIHTIHQHHYSFSLDPTDSSDDNAHSQYYSSGMPAFKSSVGDISEGLEGSEIGEDNDVVRKDRRDTHTPDLRPEEGTHIHWDPTSYESNSKYTHIITNRALPEHIKSIISRTFGPFLANYYINPHAPAIRVREKPRVDLQKLPQEQRGARCIWRNLRTESNRGVENFGERIITQEASRAFKAYVDEVKHTDMAIPKLFHPFSKAQAKRQIDDTEIDLLNVERSEQRYASRTKTASMSQLLSVTNADKSLVLAHNNEANQNSLAVSLDGTEPVDYIPFIETIHEQEDEGLKYGNLGDKSIMAKEDPAPDEKRSGHTLNANMTQKLGASRLKFLTEEESANVRPKFSKKYAYVAEVNPVKHVKRETTLPNSSLLFEPDFVPERIDLSRLARNDDKYLSCLRGAIEEREKSVNFDPSAVSKIAPVEPDNKVIENRPRLPKSTGPGSQGVNQWAPLSFTALSEYSPMGRSHLHADSGINYLDSFQIQHSHNSHP
ncbi:uncharacterized protein LOC142334627 [Convolutriloba macropyga]|uniref:uncharacterized protein LOC142334627 n=1 Tax=Convolutriloba macropyga TaxID=536237 RepID=UPI003F52734C